MERKSPLTELKLDLGKKAALRANEGSTTIANDQSSQLVDKLERLAALKDRGLLSEDEFATAKSALLVEGEEVAATMATPPEALSPLRPNIPQEPSSQPLLSQSPANTEEAVRNRCEQCGELVFSIQSRLCSNCSNDNETRAAIAATPTKPSWSPVRSFEHMMTKLVQSVPDIQESALTEKHGPVNQVLICPHCQVRGKIRTKPVKRKKGVSGGKAVAALLTGGVSILATGLSRKEGLTEAHCDNCGSKWDF